MQEIYNKTKATALNWKPVTQHIREVGRRIMTQRLRKAKDKDEHTKLVYELARRLHTNDHPLKGLSEEGKMNLLNFIARKFGRIGPQSPLADQEDQQHSSTDESSSRSITDDAIPLSQPIATCFLARCT